MTKLRLSHSQRELYSLCARKYYYRYKKKLRPREKGSALFFGSAFDDATEQLFKGNSLQDAKEKFTSEWMAHEDNMNVKFSKTDYVDKILWQQDLDALEAFTGSLNNSKPKQEFGVDKNVKKLVKELIKLRDNSYVRDATPEELRFIHQALFLSMHRKGHLMLESFNEHIMPLVTKVISSQEKINLKHPDGHTVIGYIDLLCEMEGYVINRGKKNERKFKAGEIVVADVKSAGPMAWKKHDNLYKAPQLDTYLISDEVQEKAVASTGKETNLVAYFVTGKTILTDSLQNCKKCGKLKESRHKTCPEETEDGRCDGEWEGSETFYVESKVVVGERNMDEAMMMFNDFDDTLKAIQAEIYPRNRNSCDAFGSVCDYMDICGKCFGNPEAALDKWRSEKGE